MLRTLALIFGLVTLSLATPGVVTLGVGIAAANAQPRDDTTAPVIYTVRNGDTLISIARRYLVNTRAVAKVQAINRIRDPRRIPIGTAIELPRDLLRFETITLSVAAFSGPVELAGSVPSVGAVLREGQIVATGANGFVTFSSSFGGRISVPSNSRARLLRARRYVLGEMLDVDFAILNGRGSASSPTLRLGDELRLRTPRAVTAVRGTDFRVAFDAAAARSITEVVEGEVGVVAGTDSVTAAAGFGVASAGDGLGEPEALLPAPALIDPGAIQTAELVVFALSPAPEASGHRFQIARDAGFLDVVSEQVVAGDSARFEGLENGRYFVRARAIAPSGIEGLSEAYSFRRKRIGTAASSGRSQIDDGFVFEWLAEGEGNPRFAFQLWSAGMPESPIVDETGLATTALVLTDLTPGIYEWRVAAIEAEPEGLLKVWGPTQRLTVTE